MSTSSELFVVGAYFYFEIRLGVLNDRIKVFDERFCCGQFYWNGQTVGQAEEQNLTERSLFEFCKKDVVKSVFFFQFFQFFQRSKIEGKTKECFDDKVLQMIVQLESEIH